MAFWDRMRAGIGQSTTLVGVNMAGGSAFPNNDGRGGVRYGSHASVTRAMQGSPSQHFVENVSCIVPWHWWARAAGDASSNTCGEMRRACAQILDARDNQWKWLYKDVTAGYGVTYENGRQGAVNSANVIFPGGGVSRVFPSGNQTWEIWPLETLGVPYPAETFWGAVNRDLVSNMRALCVCVQARKALIAPNGTNDLAAAKFGLQVGTDPHVGHQTGQRYIVSANPFVLTDNEGQGYPYKAYDGDYSAWELVTENWEWYGFVTGVNIPGQLTKKVGPIWGDWTWTPDWFLAPYQIDWADLQYLPAMDPDAGTTPAPAPAPAPAPVAAQAATWITAAGDNVWGSDVPVPVPDTDPPTPLAKPVLYALSSGPSPRTVVGSGMAGATVKLYVDGVYQSEAVVDGNGEWAASVVADPGTYEITAVQVIDLQASDPTDPVTLLVFADMVGVGNVYTSSARRFGRNRNRPEYQKPEPDPGSPILLAPFKTPKSWPSG